MILYWLAKFLHKGPLKPTPVCTWIQGLAHIQIVFELYFYSARYFIKTSREDRVHEFLCLQLAISISLIQCFCLIQFLFWVEHPMFLHLFLNWYFYFLTGTSCSNKGLFSKLFCSIFPNECTFKSKYHTSLNIKFFNLQTEHYSDHQSQSLMCTLNW